MATWEYRCDIQAVQKHWNGLENNLNCRKKLFDKRLWLKDILWKDAVTKLIIRQSRRHDNRQNETKETKDSYQPQTTYSSRPWIIQG